MTQEETYMTEAESLKDTELEWGKEEDTPVKKRGCFLPTWLWGCGGGCLLMIILGIGGVVACGAKIKNAMDPDAQWAKLDKILPFDERPGGLELMFGWSLGLEYYILMDVNSGYMVSVYYFDSGDAEEGREAFFNPEVKAGVMGVGERKDEELSTVLIGSRERKVMRFNQSNVEFNFGDAEANTANSGYSAVVDITPEEDPGLVAVMFMALNGQTEIPDEDLVHFFDDFYID
jgi:hypothetical protein